MNTHTDAEAQGFALLTKKDVNVPALIVTGPQSISILAGTIFAGITFAEDTAVLLPSDGLIAGSDYFVRATSGAPVAERATGAQLLPEVIGGFHFAPGGNATARKGGDETPAINPHSLWDVNFRPACSDPRGMVLVDDPKAGRFWCDIYLLGVDHLANGTSKFGVTIADGVDCPMENERAFDQFDCPTAQKVMEHHGKQLLALDEFFAAAFGVTEKSAISKDPKTTGLDAARTSKWGVMQATGNMWVWGHDGDPDEPRAAFFGGSWIYGDYAGSRYANVDYWPGNSYGHLGARGRSDHLQRA